MATGKRYLVFGAVLLALFFLLAVIVGVSRASNGGVNGLEFDGNDFVTVPHTDALNVTEFTFEAWVFLTETTGCKTILSKGPQNAALNQHGGYQFRICNGLASLWTSGAGAGQVGFADSTLSADTWYHVAVSDSGGNLVFYLNGVEDGTDYTAYTPTPDFTPFHIGRYPGYADEQEFEGQIEEVRVWNDVRTEAEIRDNLFEPLTGGEANLVAYWKLDEGSGQVVTDAHGITGTLGVDASAGADDPTWVSSTAPVGALTSHHNEVAAMWAARPDTATDSFTTGLDIADVSFLNDVGDDIVFAHNGAAFAVMTETGDLPVSVDKRWSRVWELIVTDIPATSGGNVDLTFDISDAGGQGNFSGLGTYYLLKRATGSSDEFTPVSVVSSSVSGDQLTFRVSVSELGSEFTLGAGSGSPAAVALHNPGTRLKLGGNIVALLILGFVVTATTGLVLRQRGRNTSE